MRSAKVGKVLLPLWMAGSLLISTEELTAAPSLAQSQSGKGTRTRSRSGRGSGQAVSTSRQGSGATGGGTSSFGGSLANLSAGAAQNSNNAGPRVQQSLERVRGQIRAGKLGKAERGALRVLRRLDSSGGNESVHSARAIDLLLEARHLAGQTTNRETEELIERAIRIRKEALGPESPIDVVQQQTPSPPLRSDRSQSDPSGEGAVSDELIAAFANAEAITAMILGERHVSAGLSRMNLAILFSRLGRYSEARSLFKSSCDSLLFVLGSDHPAVAECLSGLANVLTMLSDYSEARSLYERSFRIQRRHLESDDPILATSHNNLGNLLYLVGDYEAAMVHYRQALFVWERAFGSYSRELVTGRNNLGNLLLATGNFASARKQFDEAIQIAEVLFGSENAVVGQYLNNWANLLSSMGDYAGAASFYERSIEIGEKYLGPQHPHIAGRLNNLGNVYWTNGDYSQARSLYERALAINEEVFGPEHPEVAGNLNNLANVILLAEGYSQAKPLYEKALAIRVNALGPEHPDVAQIIANLANLLRAQGELDEARALQERALTIWERAMGAEHPEVAKALYRLGGILAEQGDLDRALDAALRAERIGREHLHLTALSLTESQALRYASVRVSGLDLALSLVVGEPSDSAKKRVWDSLIRSRAMLLDEMAARRRQSSAAADPEVARVVREFVMASKRLANLTVRGPDPSSTQLYRRALDEARQERERAEEALASKVAAHRRERIRRRLGLVDVASALPPGSALVAFVRYDRLYTAAAQKESAETIPTTEDTLGSEHSIRIPSYAAFVLRSGQSELDVVPLGSAHGIDSLVFGWGEEAAWPQPGRRPSGAKVDGASLKESERVYRLLGDELRRRIWDPVASRLKGANRVFVVPDGSLHLLSIAALPVGTFDYVIESGPVVHYLSAERDLVLRQIQRERGSGLLVIGDPAFNDRSLIATRAPRETAGPQELEPAAALFRGRPSGCEDFQSVRFEPLPGSELEAQEITQLWSSVSGYEDERSMYLNGSQATEAAFKANAPGKRVIHLATHGFFLGGQCSSAASGSRGIGGLATEEETKLSRVQNPLLLSGLALAGANHRNVAGPDEEDGILTAEEISAMDLSRAEWVVLSACDTGVGVVEAGEGVFGLRRAFEKAGAGTLIMSLWAVDDMATSAWMKKLYEARLQRGMGTAESVRAASMATLQQRRKKKLSTHPFYWAGFVAAGDWR